MRLIDLVQHEFEKFSTDIELMERLMVQGRNGMYAWAIRRLCFPEGKRFKGDITERLQSVTALLEGEMSFAKVRYLYYTYPTTSMDLIGTQDNFEAVYSVLMKRLNDSTFWEGVMPTCWWECVRVAIELEVERGVRVSTIARRLNVSIALVYRIRKKFLRRIIDKKGIEL
jgi:hypothetical protein